MTQPRGLQRDAIRAGILVVALHAVLTLVMTWPAAWVAGSDLFGGARGDKYQFLWNFWWVRHALLDLHQLPFWTPLQYHPTGVSLALHDTATLWSLLALPLQSFFSPETILNGILLICLPLNGFAFYRLAHAVSGSAWGALASSVVFAYCPYLLGRFHVSHIQYLPVFFVPLFLLCLWRYSREPRVRHLALAGLWLGLQCLVTFYYGVALLGILAVFALRRLAAATRSGAPGMGQELRRLVPAIAAAGSIAALLLAPVLTPMIDLIVEERGRIASIHHDDQNLETNSADLLAYFLPDYAAAPWRGWNVAEGTRRTAAALNAQLFGNRAEKSVYPGWLSWLAFLVIVGSPELRRRYGPWLALGGVFFVISLGPTLRANGVPLVEGVMPGGWFGALPLLDIVRAPSRFAIFAILVLGLCVAALIAQLGELRGRRVAAVAALGCVCISVLEFLPRPLEHHSRGRWRSDFYETIRADPRPVSVLNVPVDFHGSRGGGDLHLLAQTWHHKPIVGGYVSREPSAVFETLDASPFLRAVLQRRYERDSDLRLDDVGLADLRRSTRSLDVGYVVVHRDLLSQPEWVRVNAWLARELGTPDYRDRWIRGYVIPTGSDES